MIYFVPDVSRILAEERRDKVEEYWMTPTKSLPPSWAGEFGMDSIERALEQTHSELWGYQPISSEEDTAVSRASEQRQELLFRKYVSGGKLDSEAEARLRILTERMERLSPLLTADEEALIEKADNDLVAIQKRNQRRQTKYAFFLSKLKAPKN
jgi:predicted component of type VI protein secretion system